MAINGSDAHIISVILYPDSTTWNSSDQIQKIWDTYNETSDIVWILHDKDKVEDEKMNQEKKHHHHLFIRFQGNKSIDKFQRDFEISGHNIFNIEDFREMFMLNPIISQEMKYKSWDECVRYCCHRTEATKNKFQYPLEELHANFDFTPYFKELSCSDPWWVVVQRIVRYAKKGQRNVEEVFDYVIRNNYQDTYKKCERTIDKILNRYTWYSSTIPHITFNDKDEPVYEEEST